MLRATIVLALLALSPSVYAQPTVAHATAEEKEAARLSYQQGKEAFEADDAETALSHFRASDATVTSPNTRLMIGRCLVRLGASAKAYMVLARVVREARAWGNERYGDAAEAAGRELDGLRPDVVMLQIRVDDTGERAQLEVGGRAIPHDAWTEPIPADPGVIEVALTADDGREARRSLELAAGVAATLELSLPAAEPDSAHAGASPSIAPELAASARPASAAPPPVVASGSTTRTLSYVFGGVGVAGLAGFGVLGALSAGKFDELNAGCPARENCDPELQQTASGGQRLQTMANVSLVVGGLSLATGVVLFVLSLDDERAQVALTPDGVRLRGHF